MSRPVLTTEQWDELTNLLADDRASVAEAMEASFAVARAKERFDKAQEQRSRAQKAIQQFFGFDVQVRR